MNEVFHALSDATRRAMLHELAKGERTIGELSAPFPMTLAAASKHIRTLEKAGLLRREIRWRTHVCHLEAAPLKQAIDELAFYERFWTNRLDMLDQLLREEDAQAPQSSPPPSKGDKT